MRLGANHLVRAIVGLVVCAGAIILVLSNGSDRTLWADRLSGWPSAQGKVIRIEQYTVSDSDGNNQERQRAIVKFSAADDKPCEGMLFDEGRQSGESVKVFYDPAVDYSPNSLHEAGRQIYTEEFLADRAKQDPWDGAGIIARPTRSSPSKFTMAASPQWLAMPVLSAARANTASIAKNVQTPPRFCWRFERWWGGRNSPVTWPLGVQYRAIVWGKRGPPRPHEAWD